MMSEWLTFFLSMFCCQCFNAIPGSHSSDRDSISCYKMMSTHSVFLDARDQVHRGVAYSDTEVQIRNQVPETSVEELDITDSGETTGPSFYIEQACGEPRGQQLVVEFTPQVGDNEMELRSHAYENESSSLEATSESEPDLAQGRGDHRSHTPYRASRYESEVVLMTHYPEYESSTNQCNVAYAFNEGTKQKTDDTARNGTEAMPPSSPNSSPAIIQPANSVNDPLWEFQSCFSTPAAAAFRHTDPQCRASLLQDESEIELKNHLYTFASSSEDNVVIFQKETEKYPRRSLSPAYRAPKLIDKEGNLPAVHKTRNKERA